MKFGAQQQIWNWMTARWPNMKIFKIQEGGRLPFKKYFLAITQQPGYMDGGLISGKFCTRKQNSMAIEVMWQTLNLKNLRCPMFALLRIVKSPYLCSTCTPTTCQLHVAENSFTLTTYVSPFKANSSANWNAVSRQIWRGCHTSVDSGDLNQAPTKQSAVCSTCIIPALPVNCQFIWMACAFGMSATQLILGWL